MTSIAQTQMLYETKALLSNRPNMNTAQAMAAKLDEAIKASGVKSIDIAEACGVSKQAVQGWKKTGRIDKKHLPKLAKVTRLPLEWWLGEASTDSPDEIPGYAKTSLARLTDIGRQLTEKDWALLVATANHLAAQNQTDATRTPASGIAEQVLARQLSTETSELITHKNTGRQPS